MNKNASFYFHWAVREKKSLLYLSIMLCVTAFVSLSMHAVILQTFHPPALIDSGGHGEEEIIYYLTRFLTVIAIIFIYLKSKQRWVRFNLFLRSFLFALLLVALAENIVRVPLMNILVGNPWPYQLMMSFQFFIKFFVLSFFVCVLFGKEVLRNMEKNFRAALLIVLLSLIYIVTEKIVGIILSPSVFHLSEQSINPIFPPYDLNILIPAYITYLEPAVASFVLFYLIKDQLKVSSFFKKGLIWAGVIMLFHGGIYSLFQIIFSQGNIFYRLFYYGQFLWEYLVLGILTACSFNLYSKLQSHLTL